MNYEYRDLSYEETKKIVTKYFKGEEKDFSLMFHPSRLMETNLDSPGSDGGLEEKFFGP